MGKDSLVFGVQPLQQRYVSLMGACLYTGKTTDQLNHAVKKGHLRTILAKDGTRSFSVEDLDEFMGSRKEKGEPRAS